MESRPNLYSRKELLWPQIVALRGLGGQGANRDVLEAMKAERPEIAVMDAVPPSRDGGIPPFRSRLAWSRNALKRLGYTEKVGHGQWRLTASGEAVTEREVIEAYMAAEHAMQRESLARRR